MNKLCARCGKPVYFAERKTSLGRDWHPSCLKCHECGRVLATGQHAEHKGLPYCHHPCYRALFGPTIVGYGCSISQPKTRPFSCSLDYYNHPTDYRNAKDNNDDINHSSNNNSFNNHKRNTISFTGSLTEESDTDTQFHTMVLSTTDRNRSTTTTTMAADAGSNSNSNRRLAWISSSPFTNTSINSQLDLDSVGDLVETSTDDSYDDSTLKFTVDTNNHSSLPPRPIRFESLEFQNLAEKIGTYNSYHESKSHNHMTVQQRGDGGVQVQGPLRIYWGLSRPIQLSHCDDKPAAPVSKWRHSLHVNKMSDIPERRLSSTMSMRRTSSPSNKIREADDIILASASPDDVVRRKKKGVSKFKTVAYRGDEPTKWKRASINGHLFNYDTSVFTPVLGSCTSVVVDAEMDSMQVIKTLLDKFKVQNCTDEYVLSLVNEEGETLLNSSDKPLLERLNIGPQETLGKLFIKEKKMESEVLPVDKHIQMPVVETAEEENLPQEVEQLLVLPEAVLRGILVKFKKDEEKDVKLLKGRYEAARNRIMKQLEEISYKTSSTV